MKISNDEAVQFMRKWQDEQTQIRVAFEGANTCVAVRFTGIVSKLSNNGVRISQGDSDIAILFYGLELEYKDAREAPPHAVEWAAENVVGCLSIHGPEHAWHCSLFELKSP